MSEQKVNIEEKTVFCIAPNGTGDGVPLVMLGVPAGAWEYMKDGKTHNFDFTKVGLPIKLMLFGAKDHAEAMGYIEQMAKNAGMTLNNMLNRDFNIHPEKK